MGIIYRKYLGIWYIIMCQAFSHDCSRSPFVVVFITKVEFTSLRLTCTVYPKKYAHGFVVLCFVVVMQSFIMNSHEVFIHIHQGCFAGTGAIVRLPQCQWSKPDGYGKISQCITTTKHSKAKTVCIFLGIYCMVPAELGPYHGCWWFSSLCRQISSCHGIDMWDERGLAFHDESIQLIAPFWCQWMIENANTVKPLI